MKLTEEQRHVMRELMKLDRPIQTLGGYAGTGKTTVIQHLQQALPDFAVCAYTGKASNVLRKKGVSRASTIHRLIYTAWTDQYGNVYFSLADDIPCDGIIVDEASMVSEEIHMDLQSFGKPIIYVGDHGQLEPVGSKFNLMANPDYRLEQIHRNANEIAHFANFIREGYKPSAWQHQPGTGKRVKFVSRQQAMRDLLDYDQAICAFNKTRVEINRTARSYLGRKSDWPEIGDRVMCLRNDHNLGVFNGMQGEVLSLGSAQNQMRFGAEGREFDLFFDPDVWNDPKPDLSYDKDDPLPFDYCWGITGHKSQGDEWGQGIVFEQRCDSLWEHPRWAYTVASRFKDQVRWVPER